ncbi:ankyrin repeat domain-containing protein [Sulfurimonas crateris]|uniref:Ankyrin repeat domain-containing protein n=1 Tax=Sulfurimonas crateris TaxID=2574727 RepID=A0A4U2Z9W4_9BACT|nr:ankyrin repeat domain-containing protein [Sulfurimonas crateris]TKI70412.1 ankyrin repeat domain-containing protein [Sulfurimonas crateris]
MNDLQNIAVLILLFFLGWFWASSIFEAFKNIHFVRSEDESSKEHLPRVPFKLRKTFKNAIFGVLILLLTPLVVYTLMSQTIKEQWFIPFFIPSLIYLPFLFINKKDEEQIEHQRAELDESDRRETILRICKKLSNRESKSCRKTNTQQYNAILHYLKNSQNPDEIFEDRYTLLLPSSCCGDYKLVKSLIEHGSDVNFKSSTGNCAIHLAAKYGFEEIVELLINSGADIETKDADGKTPLMHAQENGHSNIAAILSKASKED